MLLQTCYNFDCIILVETKKKLPSTDSKWRITCWPLVSDLQQCCAYTNARSPLTSLFSSCCFIPSASTPSFRFLSSFATAGAITLRVTTSEGIPNSQWHEEETLGMTVIKWEIEEIQEPQGGPAPLPLSLVCSMQAHLCFGPSKFQQHYCFHLHFPSPCCIDTLSN